MKIILSLFNRQIFAYSLIAFPLAFLTIPIYIYLPNYYANNFPVSLKVIGIILLFSRVLDAFFDPLIGYLGDKYYQYKKTIIVFSAPLLGMAFIALFNLPTGQDFALWLFITLFFTYLLFSLIQINYQSLAVDLSSSEVLKNRIIVTRELSGVLGIIVASVLPSLLFAYFPETASFFLVSVGYFLLISIFAVIFYFSVPNPDSNVAIKTKQKSSANSNWSLFKVLRRDDSPFKNRQIKYFLTILFFNSCAFGTTASLMLFFVEQVLGAKSLVGMFLLLYFGGLLIGIPFWAKVAQKIGTKERAWQWSMIFIVVIFVFCGSLSAGDVVSYGLICLLSGFCFGADYCLSYTILTGIIQEQKLQENQTIIFGVNNFLIKFCFAIISGVMILLIGEVREARPDLEKNFLLVAYCFVPCCLKIITYFTLKKAKKLCLK